MKLIAHPDRVTEVFDLVSEAVEKEGRNIGVKEWRHPDSRGTGWELEAYEFTYKNDSVWVSLYQWDRDDRHGIYATLSNDANLIFQELEITFALGNQRLFNTRLFEDRRTVEIRNYGKITIGRRGLKGQEFFDWLAMNGYDDEILSDEKAKNYLRVFHIHGESPKEGHIGERLVYVTKLVHLFKSSMRQRYQNPT